MGGQRAADNICVGEIGFLYTKMRGAAGCPRVGNEQ